MLHFYSKQTLPMTFLFCAALLCCSCDSVRDWWYSDRPEPDSGIVPGIPQVSSLTFNEATASVVNGISMALSNELTHGKPGIHVDQYNALNFAVVQQLLNARVIFYGEAENIYELKDSLQEKDSVWIWQVQLLSPDGKILYQAENALVERPY